MTIRKLQLAVIAAATVIAAMIASSAQATLYDVNRSFTDGSSSASLTGTVNIPLGSYTIDANSSAWPFTAVNLTLTVNGTPYNLNQALPVTYCMGGTGQFFIDATPTTLTFNVNADGPDYADLTFSDTSDTTLYYNQYIIGWDYYPGFELASPIGDSVGADVTFTTVFGTAVPEPTTNGCFLLGLGALACFQRFTKKRHS
jgi:hypothetical protein